MEGFELNMEKTCYKLLKKANKNAEGIISYQDIAQITKIPRIPDQLIGSTNRYIKELNGLLEQVYDGVTQYGESIGKDEMRITVKGKEVIQQAKKERYRFYLPIVLSILAIAISVIALFKPSTNPMEKPDTYEEIVQNAVSQIMSLALEEQLAQDTQTAALSDELATQGDKLLAILPTSEGKELLDRYLSITHTLDGLQQEYLYLRGARDGVRVLKTLGALA
jgi:hypothetical protein